MVGLRCVCVCMIMTANTYTTIDNQQIVIIISTRRRIQSVQYEHHHVYLLRRRTANAKTKHGKRHRKKEWKESGAHISFNRFFCSPQRSVYNNNNLWTIFWINKKRKCDLTTVSRQNQLKYTAHNSARYIACKQWASPHMFIAFYRLKVCVRERESESKIKRNGKTEAKDNSQMPLSSIRKKTTAASVHTKVNSIIKQKPF